MSCRAFFNKQPHFQNVVKLLFNYILMNWFGIFIIFLIFGSFGQTEAHAQKEATNSSKIALTDILGDWYPKDSLHAKIRFHQIGTSLVEIDGIRHGVGNYGFAADGDSMNVNGLAINWPPYDCRLRLIGKNTLQIDFYQFFTFGTYSMFYSRTRRE